MNGKKTAALLIILIGLGTAFFIVRGDSSGAASPVSFFFGEKASPSLQFESEKSARPSVLSGGQVSDNLQTGNLTESLVQGYVGELLRNNLNAPDLGFTEEAIQEKIAEGITFTEFGLDDVKVLNDNSIKAQVAYMESIDALVRKNFSGLNKNIVEALDDFLQRGDSSSLNYLTRNIPGYVGGLIALEAPPLWKVYHLQLLNLWQKKLATYQAILDLKNDPLKSYVAIQQIPDIVSEDLTLQAILIERYEELKT
ncbi:MAG: hypothetical protein HY378_01710 [Candidatus Brennerbacteria bacterium]|nr:hypothetical protein [Candidatus Brennerbacteria bacterium]